MKHWKAYIKTTTSNGVTKQYIATVAAVNQYIAVNEFKKQYGPDSIIGWVQETSLYVLQSVGY